MIIVLISVIGIRQSRQIVKFITMKSDFVNPNVPNVQIKVRKRLNDLHFGILSSA